MALLDSLKHNTPVVKLNVPDDSYKMLAAPAPCGDYPYHLNLNEVIDTSSKLVFYMVGDTGSVRNTAFQHKVAGKMIALDESVPEADRTQFLYHLGDVVYNFGEADQYYDQFFSAYKKFAKPVFAIAGNHDSDVNPAAANPYKSLDAFTAVFCDSERSDVPFSKDINWQSANQPNVYWTLETPLANIIGLHSNVPKFGYVSPEQKKWFIEELKTAQAQREDKALLVCIHHAPFSADVNHGCSLPMIEFLESSFEESGVLPDAVFSGHVHNYQRMHKTYPNGKTVPFIVAGAGGYDMLHSIAFRFDDTYTASHPLIKDVTLEKFVDDKHGFLRLTLERRADGIVLSGDYYTLDKNSDPKLLPLLSDTFHFHL